MTTYNFNNMEESEKYMVDFYGKVLKGVENMMNTSPEDLKSDTLEKELVFQIGKSRLFHYKPLVEPDKVLKIPTMITYALVNRQYMMDIQPDRSVIRNFLEHGLDCYIVDWGYPTREDMYMTMEDYINWYMNDFVDYIIEHSGCPKINLLGVCQGGTFSSIYTALHPAKVNALVTMVTPVDFETNDGLLFAWSKSMDIDSLVDAYGTVPGSLMNISYLLLKPFDLIVDKYIGFGEKMDDPTYLQNFLRMEGWIFDSPDQAGETLRQFVKDLYQDNKLVKGDFKLGGETVNLKNIKCPFLAVVADYDHLVPKAASEPILDAVGSRSKKLLNFPVGHIGMYVSGKSQKQIAPQISEWLVNHSA